jgi:hypothetical protein
MGDLDRPHDIKQHRSAIVQVEILPGGSEGQATGAARNGALRPPAAVIPAARNV